MADNFPAAYQDLVDNTTLLERHMRDMQDCEFTVQDGVLFMLQTRNGKRTGPAALMVSPPAARPAQLHAGPARRACPSPVADPAARHAWLQDRRQGWGRHGGRVQRAAAPAGLLVGSP